MKLGVKVLGFPESAAWESVSPTEQLAKNDPMPKITARVARDEDNLIIGAPGTAWIGVRKPDATDSVADSLQPNLQRIASMKRLDADSPASSGTFTWSGEE